MEEKNNKKKNLETIIKEENLLKKEIKFIQEEYKTKMEEQKKFKDELKAVKNSFNNGLKDYTTEKDLTIEKECEIELLLSKISKLRKKMYLSINQTINKKFYTHLLEISNNKQKEKNLLKIFNFIFNIYNFSKIYLSIQTNNNSGNDTKMNINNINDKCQSINELLTIIRNETEIRNILLYSYDIFHNLQEENCEIYINIKNSFFELFKEMSGVEKQYPFDFLLDFLKNTFTIVDYEKQVEGMKEILNKLIQEKNAKFIEVKNIESIIRTYNRNIKIISNYLKALKAFYIRIKEQNKNNQINNETNKSNNVIKELIEDIEKFRKITLDYDKINSNFDAMTSLSFGTNYTLSEKSSIKSSIIDSKNNIDGNENNEDENEKNADNKKIIREKNDDKNNDNSNIEIKKIAPNIVSQPKKINNNKKENIETKNKNMRKINQIQTNSLENKISYKSNNNNSFLLKRKYQNQKKNVSLSKQNIINLTTTDNNINKIIQGKTQLKQKYPISNKKYTINKKNISFNKESKNKNVLKGSKINNTQKNLAAKQNAQNLINKEIKKRFNSNLNNNSNQNIRRGKNISPNVKSPINSKNKSQIFESKNKNKIINDCNKANIVKNEKIHQAPQNSLQKENKLEEDKNSSSHHNTLKLMSGYDKTTEKEFENRQLIISSINKYEFNNSNNRYNISKKIEQLKQKEPEESIEITMPNKENNNSNEEYFDSNNIKDSICDEMITQNFGTANNLIRSTTNDYINRLGFKNNLLWSENLYKNKAMKFKSNFKKLNIEKPIDTSSCCAVCT